MIDEKRIFQAVAAEYGLTRHELTGRCRLQDYNEARHMVIYLLRRGGMTLQRIGDLLHRNHATIYCALISFSNLLETDRRLSRKLTRVFQIIERIADD